MRFLCLHGVGTSSELFKMQTAALRFELGDDHTYEFVQGTLPWPMAPGNKHFHRATEIFKSDALTTAELSNISTPHEPHYAYFDPESAPSYISALEQLEAYLASEGPFSGVLAFSQGAGLVLTHMIQLKLKDPEIPLPFSCAILFSVVGVFDAAKKLGAAESLKDKPRGVSINIPTALIWGEKDLSWKEIDWSRALFEPSLMWSLIHQGGHEVPGPHLQESLRRTVKIIRRVTTQAILSQA